MSNSIIIDNISKSYLIQHQGAKRSTTFREDLVRRSKNILSSQRDNRETREIFWALKNVSLEIRNGEVFGIIGRNGAGKSTLLKILSRITEPTSGTATIYGKVGALLEVGTGFHPELTGRENIYLNGTLLGLKKREIDLLFDSIVDFAETEKFLDTPVKRYSSGMYVRLAFAVAAHLNPDVLIVDEVLAVGDANFQKKCIGQMGKVAREGRTVIIVTHSMVLAEALTQRCAWMEDGQVREVGATKTVALEYLKCSQKIQIGSAEGLSDYKLRRGPGQVRVTAFASYDAEGQGVSLFHRGDRIDFKMTLKVFQACKDVSVFIGFKMGISEDFIAKTPPLSISESELMPDQEIDCIVEVDTKNMPAALYDIYIMLAPKNPDAFGEYYDILDGLVTPVEIIDENETAGSRNLIPSTIKIENRRLNGK